jgi:SAM-dependent methyltransferase
VTGDDERQPLYTNRARARAFGQVAELYDRTRPNYPDELLDGLLVHGAASVLDVGCGTGILGRAFLARGCAVLGVEPDHQMADVARSHGLTVEEATFEEWDRRDRTFELLVAGQAWHLVDPALGAERAAAAVTPGGTAALMWNHAVMPDDLVTALRDVYARCAPESVTPVVIHRPESGPSTTEACFAATSRFDEPVHEKFTWHRTYGRQAWLDQLHTHSDHLLMDPDAREALLAEVGRVIDDQGGSFEMTYECHVTTFERRAGSPT